MQAKLITEGIGDLLKPKTKEEIAYALKSDKPYEVWQNMAKLYRENSSIFDNEGDIPDDPEADQIIKFFKIKNLFDQGKDWKAEADKVIKQYGRDNMLVRDQKLIKPLFSDSSVIDILGYIYRESRDEEERDFYSVFNMFVFIGKEAYKEVEVEIDGEMEKLHRKTLEIENLVKIDPTDKSSIMNVVGMKLRANMDHDLTLYKVYIPKSMWNKEYAYDSQIDHKLRKFIIKNKEPMRL